MKGEDSIVDITLAALTVLTAQKTELDSCARGFRWRLWQQPGVFCDCSVRVSCRVVVSEVSKLLKGHFSLACY